MKILLCLLILIHTNSFAQDTYRFMFLNSRKDKAELPKEDLDRIMKGHMENIERMAKEGKLIAAGPFDGGGGIFIFKAKTDEEVMEWVKNDPGIQANRWKLELFPYAPRTGGVCSVGEPYQMVHYHFVRFIPVIEKIGNKKSQSLIKKHDAYMKKIAMSSATVTEATFGQTAGSIFISKEEINTAAIEADPAVVAGVLQVEYKKLFIAKGAFCEN